MIATVLTTAPCMISSVGRVWLWDVKISSICLSLKPWLENSPRISHLGSSCQAWSWTDFCLHECCSLLESLDMWHTILHIHIFFFLNGPYFILMLFAASADISLGHVAMLILVWLIVQTYWFASGCFMPLFSLDKGLNLI